MAKFMKRGKRSNKTLKRAVAKATKPEDKLQNKAIMSLQKAVGQLKHIPQLKFLDNLVVATALNVGTAYGPYPLSYIGTGIGGWSQDASGNQMRTGNEVKPRHINIRGNFTIFQYPYPVSVPPIPVTNCHVRIMLIQYLMDNSDDAFDITQVLAVPGDVYSLFTPLHFNQYNVLYDKVMDLNVYNKANPSFHIYKKLSRKIKYYGPENSDATFNHLFIYIYTDFDSTTLASAPQPTFEYNARLAFTND